MIKNAYAHGRKAALSRFKLSNMQAGAAGYNPMINGQASAPAISPPSMRPPTSPAPPIAAGAPKAKVLG
jgi:hypothetical protein